MTTTTKTPISEAQKRAKAKYKKTHIIQIPIKRELSERVREWGDKDGCKSWNEIIETLLFLANKNS